MAETQQSTPTSPSATGALPQATSPAKTPAGQETAKDAKDHWLARPAALRWFWVIGICLLIVFTLMDFIVAKKVHFGPEAIFGFFSWFGFGVAAAFIIIARFIGILLKREETFYERHD